MDKVNYDSGHGPSVTVERLKRYGYSAAIMLISLSMGTVLIFGSPSYALSPATRMFNLVTYPIFIVMCLLAIRGILTGRIPIAAYEKPAVGILALFFTTKFSLTLLTAPTLLPLSHVESWYWLLMGIWILCFVACAFRIALYINLTVYAIALGVTIINVLLRVDSNTLRDALSAVAASNLRLTCFLIPVAVLGYIKHQWVIVEKEVVLLRRISHKDPLTGLPNRRQLTETLEAAVTDARMDVTVVLFDLDGFKNVNDSLGHAAGDDVLRQIAELAAGSVRGHDMAGRWGGEEFLIICPHTSLAEGCRVANRLRHTLASRTMIHGQRITASFGVAQLQPGETMVRLIGRADDALYAAKAKGKDQVVCSPAGEDTKDGVSPFLAN